MFEGTFMEQIDPFIPHVEKQMAFFVLVNGPDVL